MCASSTEVPSKENLERTKCGKSQIGDGTNVERTTHGVTGKGNGERERRASSARRSGKRVWGDGNVG